MTSPSRIQPILTVGFLLLATGVTSSSSSSAVEHGNATEVIDCTPSNGSGKRFPVFEFDFGHVETPLLVSLWILFVSIAKVALHSFPRLSKLIPESCLLLIIGVLLGVVLYFVDSGDDYQLDTDVFFLILLPPIIIDAGYFMPSRAFFDQFGTIILYAVIGTLLNTLMIGFSLWGVGLTGVYGPSVCLPLFHALVFASLLAAVDPVAVLAVFESVHVNQVLYIIVFGESLLNDGVSVVLYNLFSGFNEIGSDQLQAVDVIAGIGSFVVNVVCAPGIGIVLGLVGGFLSRFTHHVRIMEPLIVIVICYLSFLVPEMLHMSGILGCTFCGITMRKYVEANISDKSQTTIKYAMKMMASAAEAIIFMYLGIAAVSNDRVWNTPFILLTLLFCLIYRVIAIIIQTLVANRVRLTKMTVVDQFVMSFAGLRGAVAFSLSVLLDSGKFDSRNLFITATIVVIYFTNLVMGVAIGPLIKLLNVERNERTEQTMNEKIATRMMDHMMIVIETIADQRGHNLIRERFSNFNNKFLKPIIVGRHPRRKQKIRGRGSEIFRVYLDLNHRDARRLSLQEPFCVDALYRRRSSIVSMDGRSTGSGRSHSISEGPTSWRESLRTFGACEMRTVTMGDGASLTQEDSFGAEGKEFPCTCSCHVNAEQRALGDQTSSGRINSSPPKTSSWSDPLTISGEEYARKNTKRVSFDLTDSDDFQMVPTSSGGGVASRPRRWDSIDSSCVIDLIHEESIDADSIGNYSLSSTTSNGRRPSNGLATDADSSASESFDPRGANAKDQRKPPVDGPYREVYHTVNCVTAEPTADEATSETENSQKERRSEGESIDDVTRHRFAIDQPRRSNDSSRKPPSTTKHRTKTNSTDNVEQAEVQLASRVAGHRIGNVWVTAASAWGKARSNNGNSDDGAQFGSGFSYINEACVVNEEASHNDVIM